MTPLSTVLTICNNIEHLFIGVTKDPESDKRGFVIMWNGDHSHHPWRPIYSWEPRDEIYDVDTVIQELETLLRDLQTGYQQQAGKTEQNEDVSYADKMINYLAVKKSCPLTDEIIDKIMVEVKERTAVDVGELLAPKPEVAQADASAG